MRKNHKVFLANTTSQNTNYCKVDFCEVVMMLFPDYEYTEVHMDATIVCWTSHGYLFNQNDSEEQKDVDTFKCKFNPNATFIHIDQLLTVQEEFGSASTLNAFARRITYLFGNTTCVIAHSNLKSEAYHKSLVYTDILYNRQVCFYVDQPDSIFKIRQPHVNKTKWFPEVFPEQTHRDKSVYNLHDLDQVDMLDNATRLRSQGKLPTIYICCSFVRHPTATTRDKLRYKQQRMIEHYPGYLGNYSMGTPLMVNSNDSRHISGVIDRSTSMCWFPLHEVYYKTSMLNIYVETITYGKALRSITEKTWEPLIHGQFILPFGYQGIINDIQSYGFKLPDFIDYHYDTIPDDVKRWDYYATEVERVLDMGFDKIHEHWKNNLDILKHNRQVFFQRGYRSPLHIEQINSILRGSYYERHA